jgi:hypothetical protein
MARTQRRVQTQFTSKHTRGNDTRELARIPHLITWRCGMRAPYTQEVEHGGLGLEDCATADGTDFD